MKILFVCLGNICRSPLAEGVARDIIQKNNLAIEVDSAGTGAWHIGERPCENSIKIAKKHCIDIGHLRARQVKKEDFSRFDLLIALDSQNMKDLQSMGCSNVKLLGDFGYDGEDVPDPYYFQGLDGFENVFSMIAKAMNTLIN